MEYCQVNVFSHRGLSGDKAIDAPLLTERALLSLASRGISKFDVDLSFTSDSELFVAHPAAVHQQLGGLDVFKVSSKQLHNAAQQDKVPLTTWRLLQLVQQHNLTVALDLKGAETFPQQHATHLLALARRIVESDLPGSGGDLAQSVWLWVDSTSIARKLRRSLRRSLNLSDDGSCCQRQQERLQRLTLLKPVRDRGVALSSPLGLLDCGPSQLSEGDRPFFSMLGPSVRCANPNLLAAPWASARWGVDGSWRSRTGPQGQNRHGAGRAGGVGLLVWVVDDAAELPALIDMGVRHVISNTPLALQATVTQRCAAARGHDRIGIRSSSVPILSL